jgi:hypothetical protein
VSDPSLPLQAALVLALSGNIGAEVGTRVYDQVPDPVPPATTATFPYVTLGDCQVLPDKAECIDGSEVYPQIDVWSRDVGYPQVKRIAAAVKAVLDDQPLSVTDFNVVLFQHEETRYLRDPDGLTRHAVILFKGLITPA